MQPLSPEQEEAEQAAALERQRQLEEQKPLSKRREEAIAACEGVFHLRAPDIANRFSREQIRSLSIEDVYKEDFLVRLNERYAELTQETLENLS